MGVREKGIRGVVVAAGFFSGDGSAEQRRENWNAKALRERPSGQVLRASRAALRVLDATVSRRTGNCGKAINKNGFRADSRRRRLNKTKIEQFAKPAARKNVDRRDRFQLTMITRSFGDNLSEPRTAATTLSVISRVTRRSTIKVNVVSLPSICVHFRHTAVVR